MKKILLLCCTLFAATICLAAKEVKITVIPSDAKIYIDGNYAADGITTATLKKKDGFIVVKFEREGYVTLETKIFTTESVKPFLTRCVVMHSLMFLSHRDLSTNISQ